MGRARYVNSRALFYNYITQGPERNSKSTIGLTVPSGKPHRGLILIQAPSRPVAAVQVLGHDAFQHFLADRLEEGPAWPDPQPFRSAWSYREYLTNQ